MNLRLVRKERRPDGIFSELYSESPFPLVTLEHSYDGEPKIPNGTFTCVRGKHRLHGMTEDFETFEVTGVPGHSGILFHWGNFNRDSDGCILLGHSVGMDGDDEMILKSREAFAQFMAVQSGLDSFILSVEG